MTHEAKGILDIVTNAQFLARPISLKSRNPKASDCWALRALKSRNPEIRKSGNPEVSGTMEAADLEIRNSGNPDVSGTTGLWCVCTGSWHKVQTLCTCTHKMINTNGASLHHIS